MSRYAGSPLQIPNFPKMDLPLIHVPHYKPDIGMSDPISEASFIAEGRHGFTSSVGAERFSGIDKDNPYSKPTLKGLLRSYRVARDLREKGLRPHCITASDTPRALGTAKVQRWGFRLSTPVVIDETGLLIERAFGNLEGQSRVPYQDHMHLINGYEENDLQMKLRIESVQSFYLRAALFSSHNAKLLQRLEEDFGSGIRIYAVGHAGNVNAQVGAIRLGALNQNRKDLITHQYRDLNKDTSLPEPYIWFQVLPGIFEPMYKLVPNAVAFMSLDLLKLADSSDVLSEFRSRIHNFSYGIRYTDLFPIDEIPVDLIRQYIWISIGFTQQGIPFSDEDYNKIARIVRTNRRKEKK